MSDLAVPDEFSEWPFDARVFVLAEANTAIELRAEICTRVGMEPWHFTTVLLVSTVLSAGTTSAVLMAT